MHMLTPEYRLLRRIGSGGMGEVWEAVRVKGDGIVVPCAIKLLHADFTDTARERRLFFDEGRIATQLDHSRIVKVIDLGTARDGRPFLVMERVDGVDLRNFLKAARKESSTPLDLDVISYIVGEVLAALAYAHERTIGGDAAGIIHSDVTPGNIMISSSGEVQLTDFGIARFAAAATPMSRAIGTPRYMSPEQISGDPRRETDIYALGVVLHELLDDKRFLDGLTPDQARARVLCGPPPELSRCDVPDWLDELRRKMIATEPEQRPSTSEARAVLVEHCPRYLAAAAQLEADYARLIGRRRSGVTQLHDATELLSQPAGFDEPVRGADDEEAGEVAPTELLPPTGAVRASPEGVPSDVLRWLAIACGLAALGLMIFALVLFAKMLREPAAESTAPVLAVETKPSPPKPEPERALAPTLVQAQNVDPVRPQAPAIPVDEPTPESAERPPPVAEEPEPPPKKPRAKPEVGVMFLVETNLEGRLKAGRKIITIKNRSGYAELSPGSYKISWQPNGSDEWQLHGQVKIKNISPSRYKVRLDDGKIAEIGEL
jgi:hypothetical protein